MRGVAIAGAVALAAALLGGCVEKTPVCYGIEPDGEHEVYKPCPPGWTNGQTKFVTEDEFETLEVKEKKRRSTR